MLRKRLPLTLLAGRLSAQVSISVVATLVASAAVSLLHVGSVPARPPGIELTSGGKFAARVPGAADDRMAVPNADIASPALDAAVVPLLTASAAPAAFITDAMTAPDRPLRSKPRGVRLSGLRHGADAPLPVARRSMMPVVDTVPTAAEEGLLPKALSSARALWSISASAGSAVVSRFIP